jgi:chromosomal replication initiation ATPase DnaA
MLSTTQEIQVHQILYEASEKVSEVVGKRIRVYCDGELANNIERLKDAICDYYNISFDQLIAKDRRHERVIARQLFSWFGVKYFNYSRVKIGMQLKRDHTSIVHSIVTVEDMIYVKDEEYIIDIDQIKESLSIK